MIRRQLKCTTSCFHRVRPRAVLLPARRELISRATLYDKGPILVCSLAQKIQTRVQPLWVRAPCSRAKRAAWVVEHFGPGELLHHTEQSMIRRASHPRLSISSSDPEPPRAEQAARANDLRCHVSCYFRSNNIESLERRSSCCTSRASEGRGSSLTFGKSYVIRRQLKCTSSSLHHVRARALLLPARRELTSPATLYDKVPILVCSLARKIQKRVQPLWVRAPCSRAKRAAWVVEHLAPENCSIP